jgi:hypothetical protein
MGSLFGGGGGGGGWLGAAANFAGSFFGGGSTAGVVAGFGAANGGVMTSKGMMRLQRYSLGGIASRPQFAMFGEGSRPEAYVPLPDGRTIPVTLRGMRQAGGGGVMVNMTVQTPDASSFRRSQQQIMTDMNAQLQRAGSRR